MEQISKEQINDIRNRYDTLLSKVRLCEKEMELVELKLRQSDPEFWNDIEAAQDYLSVDDMTKYLVNDSSNSLKSCQFEVANVPYFHRYNTGVLRAGSCLKV